MEVTEMTARARLTGMEWYHSLLSIAEEAVSGIDGGLALGRVRGTGPGVSFAAAHEALESEHPIVLKSPFEGSDQVSGGVWDLADPSQGRSDHLAIAKLRWAAGADDLPMHVHEHSDRFIIVLEGRGFFHWSDTDIDGFDGSDVQTIAARERDVFVFKRGLVHTFSTAGHAMTLVSVQLPFLPFCSDRQYRLPRVRWTQGESCEHGPGQSILLDLHRPSHFLRFDQAEPRAI